MTTEMTAEHATGRESRARFVGSSVPRVEDTRLLTGRGRFLADHQLPRQLHAVFVRAELAHADIESIDTSAARNAPGVHAVLLADDLECRTLIAPTRIAGFRVTPQSPLARDRVRFAGEAVAIVVAEDRYLAEDAAELVDMRLREKGVVAHGSGGVGPALFDEIPDNVLFESEVSFGDPGRAFAAAAVIVEKTVRMAPSAAVPLECRGCLADFDPTTGELRVWCSTQGLHRTRNKLSASLGIPEHLVRVFAHDVGGAFGQKIPIQPEEVAVAAAARHLGRPVMWAEDRRENLTAAPRSRGTRVQVRLAFAPDGILLGMAADVLGDAGAYSFNSASGSTEGFLAARTLPGPYRIANYEYSLRIGLSNTSPIAPYRGVGTVTAQTARELAIDKAARVLGIDRVDLRRLNLVSHAEFPYEAVCGQIFDSGSYIESLDAVAGLSSATIAPAPSPRDRVLVGVGFSPYVEGSGSGSESTRQMYGIESPATDLATVSVDLSGTATVAVGMTSQGQGIATTLAQVAADGLGLPFDDVRVVWSDTSTLPISTGGTRASRVAVVGSGAVSLAAKDVRDKLVRAGAELLEADPADVEIENGMAGVVGAADRTIPVADVARHVLSGIRPDATADDRSLISTRCVDPGATFSNATVRATVAVDVDTGHITVVELAAAEDCGQRINPAIVDDQFRGGATQGIGGALRERFVFDAENVPLATTLMRYHLPRAADVPRFRLIHLESPSPWTWKGIKGVGESGAIGVPAAIAAAVEDALKEFEAEIASLPILPADVLALTDRAGTHDNGAFCTSAVQPSAANGHEHEPATVRVRKEHEVSGDG
ncbi:MAG: hypothetical protein ABS81_04115 [Pseudonocardia sp. SCN 72-86]|nr:MAG: hypothetical protein ABS81_04115 [Pseudonocardia sp. SCN 72-86]